MRSFTLFIGILVFSGLFLFVRPAHAGLLSFFGDLFKGEEIKQTSAVINSQTIQLPEAVHNLDPQAGVGGGENTYSENSALVPVVGPMGSMADVALEERRVDEISLYVVRDGDTIAGIAKLFGVSRNTIVWANDDLKNGKVLRPGQMLTILPISGVQYEVKKGDTVTSLAKKFRADAGDIIVFNNLDADKGLDVGSEIIIPDGEIDSPNVYYGGSVSGDRQYAGYYMRPLVGGRNSRATSLNPHGLHGKNAVDIAAPEYTPILASASGDVIIARSSGWNGGYGKYIVIQHPNGTQTLYGHMSDLAVAVDWHVVQGQVIGYIGNTGNSTGRHLHFEIRGGPRNPF
jgi:murein DD-endopeptidase MepM/ murein hydrolase activator NlpD